MVDAPQKLPAAPESRAPSARLARDVYDTHVRFNNCYSENAQTNAQQLADPLRT